MTRQRAREIWDELYRQAWTDGGFALEMAVLDELQESGFLRQGLYLDAEALGELAREPEEEPEREVRW